MSTTDLVIPETTQLQTAFRQPEAIDRILADVEARARAHVPDLGSATGRKAIASVAYQVARSKTAFDEAGKALAETMRRQISAVDAERRRIRDRLDALRDEVRAPLTEWERAEEERIAAITARIQRIADASGEGREVAEIERIVGKLEDLEIDDSFAELVAEAAKAKDAALRRLRTDLDAARYREELTRREAEAAERRRLEDETRRRAEAERQEAERAARVEAEKKAAVEAAERRAREAAEREAAEKIRLAEARMRQEREAEDRARAEAEAAVRRERERQEQEAKALAEAEAKRAADKKHRAAVRAWIAGAVEALIGDAALAATVANALMAGKVPHVEVKL